MTKLQIKRLQLASIETTILMLKKLSKEIKKDISSDKRTKK